MLRMMATPETTQLKRMILKLLPHFQYAMVLMVLLELTARSQKPSKRKLSHSSFQEMQLLLLHNNQ